MSQKQRQYNPEFRQSAIRLVLEQGYTHNEAADRLGMPVHTLKYWIKQHHAKNSDAITTEVQSQADELKQLRKENLRLQMENEILKKAAAYFAKESL